MSLEVSWNFPVMAGDHTRRAQGRQRVRLLDTVGFWSQADIGARSARFVLPLKAAAVFSGHFGSEHFTIAFPALLLGTSEFVAFPGPDPRHSTRNIAAVHPLLPKGNDR
jgi:hypothetical protein